MTIKVGDNPEGNPDTVKFLIFDDLKHHKGAAMGERGTLLALNKKENEAIVRSIPYTGDIKSIRESPENRAKLYRIKEVKKTEYPYAMQIVRKIPKGFHKYEHHISMPVQIKPKNDIYNYVVGKL